MTDFGALGNDHMWFEGGCHCKKVRYKVKLPVKKTADGNMAQIVEQVLDCNCSMCFKKGILHVIVLKDNFQLLSGEDSLTTYQFGTKVAKHFFCQSCGIHPFYIPRSHPNDIDLNVRSLDIANLKIFQEIAAFNGREWENNVHTIQNSNL
eukprot:TRINITY_DN1029_c0_g1_i1.p2 TRINITY_DN1029_c0_g1~~TRINITY_DN1029_c0_g1_i1.p2  ORF type:complete len:150 (+),score=49.32 TRINITY_DN1029_c0_g1_i1:1354-1803(+)